MHGSDRVPDLKTITSEPTVGKAKATPSMRAKWRSSSSACSNVLKKCLTRADIVREAILRQSSLSLVSSEQQFDRKLCRARTTRCVECALSTSAASAACFDIRGGRAGTDLAEGWIYDVT